MSTFTRPSSPTKHRSNGRPITPTKSKSMSNICTSGISPCVNPSSAKVLEEINLLLHLEILKRNKENEFLLTQKIEEDCRLFEERRQKYCKLVSKYAALVKLASTRKVLLRNEPIKFAIESASMDAKSISEKLSSGSATDYINTAELTKFKNMLQQMEEYKNLSIRRSELVDLQNSIDTIQYSIEAIEKLLEKSITEGLDHFVEILDMTNFPRLLEHNE